MKSPQLRLPRVDLAAVASTVQSQFRDLNPKEPGQWPIVPKVAAWVGAGLATLALGWFLVVAEQTQALEAAEVREQKLKTEYRDKLAQAINLEALTKQKQQVQEYVTQLEKQLPGKAEIDALLSDINNAARDGGSLQVEQITPGQVVVKDYYAELPIAIKVAGRYDDLGRFASNIAHLSRIVTLHDLVVQPAAKDPNGALVMESTARTYRYLDPEEVAQARKAAAAKEKGKGKGKPAPKEGKK
ncbi:type IV pilus inner membrane component PilO [Ideonella livida]|uniref:Type 4a pilus biogenesis protein PilO n=1 Tax=Ideonella livida TaxID=2707176 RepID=A0A7C9PIZ0_9BURK|nr:type 4a pilus biogenesis protein PilO [Ideonella livida]NDY92354.1 type 4a pilus biogenesis protein PilO [Ideonella livida]